MILLLSTCAEKLHELEFVKPVAKILLRNKINFFVKHYSKISDADLKKADKVIICGTSLKDFGYTENLDKFEWINSFEKPVLGICAGAQIIALVYKQKLWSCTEIGETKAIFRKEFFGLVNKQKIYSLHQMAISLDRREFMSFTKSKKGSQAFKKINKPFYGVLFHPEVWNHEVIERFARD